MIMISGVITVQLHIRVDGGIIVDVTTLTSTDKNLLYIAMYSLVRQRFVQKIVSHNNS